MLKKFRYYFWSTYRRRLIDKLQEKYSNYYCGIVLDIGGRDRGKFKKPKSKVDRWIFADIDADYKPDIVLDVSNMHQIADNSIDVINAIELFEHVQEIEKSLFESHRVLKSGGTLLLSVPFLYPIHADPSDFQRWTLVKWKNQLHERGFKLEKVEICGYFFTVLGDMFKSLIRALPVIIRQLCYVLYPLIDLLVLIDQTKYIKQHKIFGAYHGGYFLCISKP